MPTPFDSGGVAETLDELERKLRELERQLTGEGPAAAGGARAGREADRFVAAPPPEPADREPARRRERDRFAPPPEPAPPPAAAEDRLGSLAGQLDELEQFREQLQRTARELEDEYARLAGRLGSEPEADVEAPPREPEPARQPPPRVGPPRRTAPADPTATYSGAVVLDAGPFSDIAALGGFEQALARARGVDDVYVSGFEGRRAIVELELSEPVALLAELRAVLPTAFTLREATADRLAIDLEPPEPAA